MPDRKRRPTNREKQERIEIRPGPVSQSEIEMKLARLEAEIESRATSRDGVQRAVQVAPEDKTNGDRRINNMALFWALVILLVVVSKLPFAQVFFLPLNQFTTMIHEMGHALACLATGGHVSGMTIVADGAGHGGLTYCQGGLPFITVQAGYLGTAIFGCLLVYLGQFRKLAKPVLVFIGLVMAAGTLLFISQSLFSSAFWQGILSLVWGLALSGATVWAGLKLKERTANVVLLILAIQTALDSVRSIGIVMMVAMMGTPVMSDASNMQLITGLPAIFWAVSWALISVVLLALTVWRSYGGGAIKLLERQR